MVICCSQATAAVEDIRGPRGADLLREARVGADAFLERGGILAAAIVVCLTGDCVEECRASARCLHEFAPCQSTKNEEK